MVKQIDVEVGPFWWEEWRGWDGQEPWSESIPKQRSNGRVVDGFNNSPHLKQLLKWAPGNKHGYTLKPEGAYIRDGENFYEACPHASSRVFVDDRVFEENPIKTNLRCDYPAYSPNHTSDFDIYNKLKSVTTSPVGDTYKNYYTNSCKSQQEALERTGHTFATGTSGTACQSKNHGIADCQGIGMPLDQCHYGSKEMYKTLCTTEGAKNGQYNIQNGKHVFSFEYGFNPSGANGICSNAAALKEYSRRVNSSGLNNQIVGVDIAGRTLTSMNELHKQCEGNRKINGKTGEISPDPLRGVNCTASALKGRREKFDRDESSWNALEQRRIDQEASDARFAELERKRLEAEKNQAEMMKKMTEQQVAAAEKQTTALNKIGDSGNQTNKVIEQLASSELSTPTTKKPKETNKPKKTKKSTKKSTKKKDPKKKSKRHIYIAIAGAVFAIILLVVLFMPSWGNPKVNNVKSK